jgi:protein subunit release factor A
MNLKDLRIEFYKSGGPGGQHKNKRFMAVRVTHLPTGLVAVGQESRSQTMNKTLAFERLAGKLKEKARVKKKRIPTREPKSVKSHVLDRKKRHGLIKKLRHKKISHDE